MDISTPRSNLVVRFISVFLLCCTSLYALADQTGKQKITLVASDVTLETVFKQIEKQTGLRFMYAVDAVDVKEKVTVAFEKTALDDVLGLLLGQKGIGWVYREGVISLKRQTFLQQSFSKENDIDGNPRFSLSGKVLDAKGEPIPGATVVIKGTKKGVKADGDGSFVLQGVELNMKLLVSSIGFETIEVVVEAKSLVVRMKEVIGTLDEKIIVGYGTTTTRLNLGNVTSIKAEEIARNPVSNPILALQGRVPGMIINQTTGLSGGQLKIQVRGRNSIDNGVQPLFVIDGVPYQPQMSSPAGSYGALGNIVSALNFVNPSDIESIDVLKDADATAIYGSRGANGVILITTKKGKVGDVKVSFNINKGLQNIARKRRMLNTPQYLEMRREAFKNDNFSPDAQNAPDLILWDTTRYTDWQKDLVGGIAHYSDVQTSISGGVTTVQYLLGGNYHKETTIYPGDYNSQRGGAHFSLIGNSKDQRFRSSLTGNYVIGKNDFPGSDFARKIILPPNAPPAFNSNGSLNWENSTWLNPYAQLVGNISDAKTTNMIANIDVSYHLFQNLVIKGNIGYNELRGNTFNANLIAGVDPAFQRDARALGSYIYNKATSWISEPLITYSTGFGRSSLNVLVGATLLMNKFDNQYVSLRGIREDALVRMPAAASAFLVINSGNLYKYAAYFTRVNYNFNNKYLLNLTFRRDGSSRFGPRKQFANFGSVGAGWIFSEDINSVLTFLSFGKLRASYGITGNDQIGDYRYLNQYEFSAQPYTGEKGLKVVGLYNPDFTWEQTKKAELGLELGFLEDRIFVASSFYKTNSSNQLLSYTLPIMTGSSSVVGNVPAKIINTGFELVVNSKNIKTKNFNWSTLFNLTIARNKLAVYTSDYYSNDFVKEGESLSNRYLYNFMGVNSEDGSFQFSDSEGKPAIDYAADIYAASVDLNPQFYGGFQNSFQYKAFRLDILLQFVKQQGFKGIYNSEALPGTINNQPVELMEDRWRKPGDVVSFQRLNQDYSMSSAFSAFLSSSESFGDASFIRCKNMAFSWLMSEKLTRSIHLSDVRVYLQGQNLFTITKYKGWDPETQSLTSIPPLRVITAGVQFAF